MTKVNTLFLGVTTSPSRDFVGEKPAPTANSLDPWDRQPGESGKAFSAFLIFRDLGPRRSLNQAGRLYCEQVSAGRDAKEHQEGTIPVVQSSKPLKKKNGRIGVWARRYNWQARALAFDAYKTRLQKLVDAEDLQQMKKRHVDEALLLQQKAVERLKDIDAASLSHKDALEYLVKGTDLERKAKGLATEILEHSGPGGGAIPITTIEVYKQERQDDADNEPDEAPLPASDGDSQFLDEQRSMSP